MPDTLVSSDLNLNQSSAAVPTFRCTSSDDGFGAAWVRVAGELDHAAAPQLASMLSHTTRLARIVILDLRELTRVDSSGVGAIVDASRSARRVGRRLILVRGPQRVERLFALTGASDAVEIVDLAAGEPVVLALLQIAHNDLAGKPKRARVSQRFSQPPRSLAASALRSRVASNTTSSVARTAAPNTGSQHLSISNEEYS
jgi:anti-sigma B factor antagonist